MTSPPEHLALYGSLMASLGGLRRFSGDHDLVYGGPCRIPGRLLDLGDYPGLVAGEGRVRGELHRLRDPAVLAPLDAYEGYDASDPGASLFLRVAMTLCEPALSAWVYVYNGNPGGHPQIASGDWRHHLALRSRGS